MDRPTQMPLSYHSTSFKIRIAWSHQNTFQCELWNTPCRFDSVNIYSKRLLHLSKVQRRKKMLLKQTHTEKTLPPPLTHIYPGSMKTHSHLNSKDAVRQNWFLICNPMYYGLKHLKSPYLSPWNNPAKAKEKRSQVLKSKYYRSRKSLSATPRKTIQSVQCSHLDPWSLIAVRPANTQGIKSWSMLSSPVQLV